MQLINTISPKIKSKTIAALNPFNILVSSKIKKTGPIIKLKKIPKELQLKYRLPLKFINTLLFFYDSPSKSVSLLICFGLP
jgi:hypothetical protein